MAHSFPTRVASCLASGCVEALESRQFVQREDRWEFKPHGRLSRLVRAAFAWAVRKGHFSNAFDERIEFSRHVIKPDSVIEAVVRQRAEVFEVSGRHPRVLVIGADDYSDLMSAPDFRSYFEFDAKVGFGDSVCGLKVKIVPWIRGVAVLP